MRYKAHIQSPRDAGTFNRIAYATGAERCLLTIVVPSYNMERYLPICLGSVFSSDTALLSRLEVIVVNDGSTDRTGEVARSFGARVVVIDKPNGHYGSCVNAGLAAARGLYIKVLDADDSLESGACGKFLDELSRLVDGASSPDELPDLVVSNYSTVDPEGRTMSQVAFSLPREGLFDLNLVGRGDLMNLKHHAIAYRTEMVRSLGYRQSEGVLYSDMEWFTLPMARVRRVRYLDLYLNRYLIGRTGQSVEQATFAKNYQVVVQLMKTIAREYVRLAPDCPPAAADYFRRLVTSELSQVYQAEMLGIGGHRVDVPLAEFDAFLQRESPELHQALDADFVSRLLKFHPVREWRKGGPLWPLKLSLFRLYAKLIRLLRR